MQASQWFGFFRIYFQIINREGLLTSASEYGIRVEDVLEYPYGSMDVFWNGNSFAKDGDAGEWITVRILSCLLPSFVHHIHSNPFSQDDLEARWIDYSYLSRSIPHSPVPRPDFHSENNIYIHADIRSTIRKQILMVFGFPAAGAVIHTLCSITMTIHLLRTLNLFNTVQIYQVTAGVIGVFLLLYGVSYMITARTYMKIVKSMRYWLHSQSVRQATKPPAKPCGSFRSWKGVRHIPPVFIVRQTGKVLQDI